MEKTWKRDNGTLWKKIEGWSTNQNAPPSKNNLDRIEYFNNSGMIEISLSEHYIINENLSYLIGRKVNDPNISEIYSAIMHGISIFQLNNYNINFLKQITNRDIWVQDEIIISNYLSPLIAFNILKSLGFKAILDTATGLMEVQTTNAWWGNLSETNKKLLLANWPEISDETSIDMVIDSVNGDDLSVTNFTNINFLNHVVNFVNSNPSIINLN